MCVILQVNVAVASQHELLEWALLTKRAAHELQTVKLQCYKWVISPQGCRRWLLTCCTASDPKLGPDVWPEHTLCSCQARLRSFIPRSVSSSTAANSMSCPTCCYLCSRFQAATLALSESAFSVPYKRSVAIHKATADHC